MGKLVVLGIIACIGMIWRYWMLGKWEWPLIMTAAAFLLGAGVVGGIQRWQARRDERFIGAEHEHVWHFHLADRDSTKRKFLWKGNEKAGEFYRFFPHRWQQFVHAVLSDRYQWHLHLSCQFADGTHIELLEEKKKWFRINDQWKVVRNGTVVAIARTDYSWKNKWKMRKHMIVEINGQTWLFQSSELRAATEVLVDGRAIAKGERPHMLRPHYTWTVQEAEYQEWESVLVALYILFCYVHHQ